MNRRFAVGDGVRVRVAEPPGHVRTPHYCRGRIGVVIECLGAFANPERLAYRHTGSAPVPLYRVRFRNAELWPSQHAGIDETEIEIFEHWLEPAPAATHA